MRGLIVLGWLILLAVVLWPLVRWLVSLPGRSRDDATRRAMRDELVKDPVCRTYVVRSQAVTRQTAGTTYYFCSRECATRFSGIPGER